MSWPPGLDVDLKWHCPAALHPSSSIWVPCPADSDAMTHLGSHVAPLATTPGHAPPAWAIN